MDRKEEFYANLLNFELFLVGFIEGSINSSLYNLLEVKDDSEYIDAVLFSIREYQKIKHLDVTIAQKIVSFTNEKFNDFTYHFKINKDYSQLTLLVILFNQVKLESSSNKKTCRNLSNKILKFIGFLYRNNISSNFREKILRRNCYNALVKIDILLSKNWNSLTIDWASLMVKDELSHSYYYTCIATFDKERALMMIFKEVKNKPVDVLAYANIIVYILDSFFCKNQIYLLQWLSEKKLNIRTVPIWLLNIVESISNYKKEQDSYYRNLNKDAKVILQILETGQAIHKLIHTVSKAVETLPILGVKNLESFLSVPHNDPYSNMFD